MEVPSRHKLEENSIAVDFIKNCEESEIFTLG